MIGKTPVLGVDIGEQSAKYVLLSQSGGKIVLEHFGIVPLKGSKGETVDPVAMIRAQLTAKGIKAVRTVGGISGQSVFLRFVRLPPVPKKQMDQIVRYEAQQQVPFPIEEVRWDYQVLSSASEEERDVILVAVKNEIVEQMTRSFVQAGLQPSIVDVSVLAIYNCLSHNQTVHPGTSSLILDIGAKTTHMIVADRGGIWVRNIPIAGNHLTQAIAEGMNIGADEAEKIKIGLGLGKSEFGLDTQAKQQLYATVDKALGRLFAEVSRSLGFYRSQYPNAMVNDVYLCGGGALLRGLEQAAKERFNLPVKRLDSFAGFQCGAGVNPAELARDKIFLGGAMGLALRLLSRCRLHIDLIPHDVARKRAMMRRVAYVAGTYGVIVLMGLVYGMYSNRLSNIRELRTAVLDASLKDMQALSWGVYREKDQVDVLRGKFQRIEQAFNAAEAWPAMLSSIGQAMPNNFWLVRIAGEKAAATKPVPGQQTWGYLVLEGKTYGDIDRDLPLFREALSKIPLFSDVEIVSAQVENGVVEFTLKLKVKA